MRTTIVIDERFNGPPAITNGGYACATVAERLGGLAETTLLRPVPVGRPLLLTAERGRASLHDETGGQLAEAVAIGGLDTDTPAPVSVADAAEAMTRYPGRAWEGGVFPCFVCGPDRPDSFGVLPGPVPERDVVAALWQPERSLADGDGEMSDRFSWAVLDCTGSWAAMIEHGLDTVALLGRMTAQTIGHPRAGETYVAVGWAGERDGRKLPAGAAIFAEDGSLLSHARLLCIEPRGS